MPGSINVAQEYKGGFWYGRIHRDGNFEPCQRIEQPTSLVPALKAFAADPARVAAEHGKLTGKCCFCNSALTDPRSTAVGYGKTCASHFGLPWGAKAACTKTENLFDAAANERHMQQMEAAADREQTRRDEANKHAARAAMEFMPDPGELAQDRWVETHY